MTVEVEEFNQWRVSIEARIARLEALYFTRYDCPMELSYYGAVLRDHTARLINLKADQAKVLAGIGTIVGLLNGERDGGESKPS
jgi:hypothetical protein